MRGLKKKNFWKKQREINAKERELRISLFTAKKPKKKPFTPLRPRSTKYVITEEMKKVASLPSGPTLNPRISSSVISLLEDEEYSKRESLAREEIERKKSMVAPLYNKGGYQYVGDAPPEIIKNLGRKV